MDNFVLRIKIKKPDGKFIGDLDKHKLNLDFYEIKIIRFIEDITSGHCTTVVDDYVME